MVALKLSQALLENSNIGEVRRPGSTTTRSHIFMLFASCFLLGCSQDLPVQDDATREVQTSQELDNTRWQAIRIGTIDVPEQSTPTLLLNEGGQLEGTTGCNQYFGRWSAADSDASFDATGVSLRACEPPTLYWIPTK